MNTAKIFAAVCALILAVCLTLSITALTALRNAVDESKQAQQEAECLMEELNESLGRLEIAVDKETDATSELPVNAEEPQTYVIRSCNGKIAIYTSSGSMLDWIDVHVDLLPKSDQEALATGIEVDSLEALWSLLMDYAS